MRVIVSLTKKTGKYKGYSSLESFFEEHENYREKKETIEYYLSRKKTFFEDSEIKLLRLRIIGRKAKSKHADKGRI